MNLMTTCTDLCLFLMKHRLEKILAIILLAVVLVGFTGYDVASAAGYSAYAYSLNLKPEDSQEFINRIRAASSSYTASNTAVRFSTQVTQSHFEANTHNIKYWASEGNSSGEIWSIDFSGSNVDFYLSDIDLKSKWGGNSSSDLEFLFLAACNLVNGEGSNPRNQLANAMIGPGAMRAICGYHSYAPSAADEQVVEKFMDYVETGESVKSSWMQANEYVYSYGSGSRDNCKNYIVLTHDNNSQYSRFPGFPGSTYSRPTSSTSIVRFSRSFPDGNDQELRSLSLTSTPTDEQRMHFQNSISEALPLLSHTDVTLSATEYTHLASDTNGVVSIVNDEIKDTPISLTESTAKQTALSHILSAYAGIEAKDLDSSAAQIAPIVKAQVNLTGNADTETEAVVAYIVNIQNQYNGIPIDGSVFSVAVDDAGIPFSNGKWARVEPVQANARSVQEPISMDHVIHALRDQIGSDQTANINATEEVPALTIQDYDVIYKLDDASGMYRPVCRFFMQDGSSYDVDLLNAQGA
jgi:hypothetical protein